MRQNIAAAVGLLGTSIDFYWSYLGFDHFAIRLALGLLVLFGMYRVSGLDRRALFLNLRPESGWRRWIGLSLIAAAVAIAVIALVYGRDPNIEPGVSYFRYPVIEELVYRLNLCIAVMLLIGNTRWAQITNVVISGSVFAALHYVYGNLAVENVVGGFVLATALLASRSFLIPLVWHALGNVILASWIGSWLVFG